MAMIDTKERARLRKMSLIEKSLYKDGYQSIAGVDEVGRGPLAGPVVAAAAILPKNYLLSGIDDSKRLDEKVRTEIYHKLIHDPKVIYSVAIIDVDVIDKINILQASLLAMKKAVGNLQIEPSYLLIDGNKAPHGLDVPHQCLIKGDSRSISIASASIIAKCTRDQMMIELHENYPSYGFNEHKGYATEKHLQALREYGPLPVHRKTFGTVKEILQPSLFSLHTF